jgi:hypothetical protein
MVQAQGLKYTAGESEVTCRLLMTHRQWTRCLPAVTLLRASVLACAGMANGACDAAVTAAPASRGGGLDCRATPHPIAPAGS